MRRIASAAIVPNTVDNTVETSAIITLLLSASITCRFWNKDPYHLKVNPLQLAFSRESLNEKIIINMIGM